MYQIIKIKLIFQIFIIMFLLFINNLVKILQLIMKLKVIVFYISRAFTPGNSMPSRNSNEAPPPVET